MVFDVTGGAGGFAIAIAHPARCICNSLRARSISTTSYASNRLLTVQYKEDRARIHSVFQPSRVRSRRLQTGQTIASPSGSRPAMLLETIMGTLMQIKG
jgi:hypothetical protein